MRLKADAFKQWAESAQPRPHPLSWKKIAEQTNYTLVTVLRQKSKDSMDPALVLRMSRHVQLNPLEELARFPGFEVLGEAYVPPTQGEVLTQIPPELVLDEVRARLMDEQGPGPLSMPAWGEAPYAFSSWMTWVGPRDFNAAIRSILGVSMTAVAKKLSNPQFKVEEIVTVCHQMRLNTRFALLILGYITPEEAGVPHRLREDALKYARGEELVDQMHHSEKFVRRRLQIADNVADAIETLS